jgi:hypothetical protein
MILIYNTSISYAQEDFMETLVVVMVAAFLIGLILNKIWANKEIKPTPYSRVRDESHSYFVPTPPVDFKFKDYSYQKGNDQREEDIKNNLMNRINDLTNKLNG